MWKIARLFRAIKTKMRYGKKLHFASVPILESGAKFNIKNGQVTTGRGFYFRSGCYMAVVNGGAMTIGNDVFFNRHCMLVCQESISIGDHCGFGPNVVIYDHDHRFGKQGILDGYKTAPVVIEKECWIGAGAIILRGTHIGEGCVIGAGAVVKGEIPPHSLVTSQGNRTLSIVPIEDRP